MVLNLKFWLLNMSFSPQLSIEELLRFLLAQQSITLRQGFAIGEVQDVRRGRKLEETHRTSASRGFEKQLVGGIPTPLKNISQLG